MKKYNVLLQTCAQDDTPQVPTTWINAHVADAAAMNKPVRGCGHWLRLLDSTYSVSAAMASEVAHVLGRVYIVMLRWC